MNWPYQFLKSLLRLIYYDSTRIVAERWLQTDPETASYHLVLGTALAGLGRFSDGIREGKRAAELVPISQDALYGTGIVEELAYLYVLAGEFDLAIDQLDMLMSIPSGLGIYVLHHHPKWDPLRDHVRFQALLEKYDEK